jgi:AcrR family transcriptional regulator
MNRATVGVMEPNRRQTLLVTAAHEFARAGFRQASLNAIIRACGISKSSFYHYFASKDALFDTVVAEAGAQFAAELQVPEPACLDTRFWAQVEALFERLLELSARQPWYIDLGKLFHLTDVPADGSPALRRAFAGAATWLDAALAAGRRGGAVRDDMPADLQCELVFAVLQAMDRWSLQHAHEFDEAFGRTLATQQLAALQRLLAP